MANVLSIAKQTAIITALVEGCSVRSTARMTGTSKGAVLRTLVKVGKACQEYQDATVRNIKAKRVQVDEIWSFCYAKQKNVPEEFQGTPGYGDVWTWVAIDAETKLVPSWLVGERTTEDCYAFMRDLRSRFVPGHRFQLSTDGFGSYPPVVDALWRDGIDFAQIIKEYGQADNDHRYSPAVCTSIKKKRIAGDPDEDLVSTSYVERQNLTMRMGMRRFTRLTNAFSKKIENHVHAVNLFYAFYNLCRVHQTLTKKYGQPTTPAMAAGIEAHPWSVSQLCALLDSN
jgi:IS1 family transposase